MEQGFQGWEYKFNTVASSRGDYPFITVTIGLGTSVFAKMASKACLKVRSIGQGKPGFKKPVLELTETLRAGSLDSADSLYSQIDVKYHALIEIIEKYKEQ